jgi:hypothetical protein
MDTLLCLTHPRHLRAALVAFDDGGAGIAACDGDRGLLASVLAPLAAGAHATAEFPTENGGLGVDRVLVKPGHPLYPAGVADACRAAGYEAVFLEPPRARAWFLVRTMPLGDEEFRHDLLAALPNLPGDEVEFLLSELEATAAELDGIEARRKEEMGEVRAELERKK